MAKKKQAKHGNCRLKTKEEMLNEFGDDWKDLYKWPKGIDLLLGTELSLTPTKIKSIMEKHTSVRMTTTTGSKHVTYYNISSDMIIIYPMSRIHSAPIFTAEVREA